MLTSLQLQRKEKIKTLDKKIIEIQNRNVFLEKNLIDIKEAADHQKPNLKDKVTNLTTKKELQEKFHFAQVVSLNQKLNVNEQYERRHAFVRRPSTSPYTRSCRPRRL